MSQLTKELRRLQAADAAVAAEYVYGEQGGNVRKIAWTGTPAELAYLDIATLGTGAASKAVVLNASGDYTYPASATIVYPSSATLTLQSGSTFNAAGTLQIGAVTVSSTAAELNYNDITTLGTLAASKTWTSDASLDTIMPTGGKLTVQSGGDITLESGSTLDVAGTFEIANTAVTASAAELNYNDITTLGTGAASKAVVLDADGRYRLPSTGTLFNAGKQTKAQAAPAAKTTTAGISAAELVAGLITTTGVSAPSSHQLPTGTEIDTEFPGIATGDSFDVHIINTGTGAGDDVTLTVNTDVTIVGNPTVGALTDTTILSGSGTFRFRRSATNTYVCYRIA